jgi:hypothetical protein
MMTSLALGLLLAPLQYSFEPGTKLDYRSTIVFEGFIPILGGNEGTVVVEMGVTVEGLARTKPENARSANEITSFRVTFNDAPLPFDASSVQSYFPRTTINVAPSGKIVETDAPNVQLPVRLPGLHVRHFPDVTYVPIEFPKDGPKIGEPWGFTRKFGDSDVVYECWLVEQKGDVAKVAVKLSQEYEVLENAALEVVTEEKNAERRVKTVLTGAGTVVFDTKRGIVTRAEMVNVAESDATKLVDGTKSRRDLKTTFTLVLNEKPHQTAVGGGLLGAAKKGARAVVTTAKEWWAVARLAVKFALGQIPTLMPGNRKG